MSSIFAVDRFTRNITVEFSRFIDSEQPRIYSSAFGWKAYYRLEIIYQWLDEQIKQYPTLLTNLTVGKSYEGRTIRAVKLSHKKVTYKRAAGFEFSTKFINRSEYWTSV